MKITLTKKLTADYKKDLILRIKKFAQNHHVVSTKVNYHPATFDINTFLDKHLVAHIQYEESV